MKMVGQATKLENRLMLHEKMGRVVAGVAVVSLALFAAVAVRIAMFTPSLG
jgi:hypothetical protein